MISITVSIFLLCFACIAYPKDPAPVRRKAIKAFTIIDILLTSVYLYFFVSIAVRVFKDTNSGTGIYTDDVMLMLILLLPIALALPAILFGIKALLDKSLIAKGMANEAKEKELNNKAIKYCIKCNTSVPYYENECKHCKGTEFTTDAPGEISIIPQQIRNNTPSDDEI